MKLRPPLLLLGAATLLAATVSGCTGQGNPKDAAAPGGDQVIGVYSGRHYNTDKELYKEFTRRTGIKVNLLEGKDDALIERVKSEGPNSPADLLVLVDAARLDKATGMGLFQPTQSAALERDVPANLRDSQGRWFALTRRVRAALVNPKRVDPASIRSYADLASPALQGQLCLRNSKSVYNQSLVADQIIQRGEAATQAWVKGMVANTKQPFFTSDTPLARAVAKGDCGVGLVNTYYVARMLSGRNGAEDKALAAQAVMVFPDPAHVNVSGGGVTRHARNPEAARQLLAFLASPSGGKGYAEANLEYPLRGYGNNDVLKGFGTFRSDGVSAEQMGAKNKEAVALMRANGWK